MHCLVQSSRVESSRVELSSVGLVSARVCVCMDVNEIQNQHLNYMHTFCQTSNLFKMHYFRQIASVSSELTETCHLCERHIFQRITYRRNVTKHLNRNVQCSMLLLTCNYVYAMYDLLHRNTTIHNK